MYIFLVLLLYTTVVKSNSDTKYIDLLPEKEKEEFLENIARRILEEVETKSERSGKSIEVSDSQLDKQNDFVHKILQEENENLRKQANSTYTLVTSNNNTNNSPLALREDENKLQQYVDLTLRTDIDKSRSKRDSKRRVFTGYADENSKEDTKENKGAESELDVQVRNFQKKSTDNDYKSKFDDESVTKTGENVTTDQIKAKLDNDSDENNITQMLQQIYEENEHYNETTTETIEDNKNLSTVSLISSDINQTTVSNEQSELENENFNETTTKKIEGNKNLSTASFISSDLNQTTVSNVRSELETLTIDNTDNYFATEVTASEPIPYEVIQKTFHPLANTSFDDSIVDEHKIDNGDLRAYALVDVDETIVLRSSNATKNVNVTEVTPYSSSRNSTQRLMTTTESNEHANDSKVINIDVITVSPVETSIHHSNENTENDFLEQTTPKIQVLTTTTGNVNSYLNISSDISKISSNNNTKRLNEATKRVRGDAKAKQVFKNKIINATELLLNGVIKSLRENLVISDKKEDKASVKPIQTYNVYEIAPDATPFVKKDVPIKQSLQKSETLPKSHKPQPNKLVKLKKKPTNVSPEETIVQEEPHYVPIYNYQPNNAFYNPHEAFELNASKGDDDNDEKSQYGANSLPSLKSIDDYDNEERSININNNNQPMQVPIYVYAPQNAFFDPNNNLGPNAKDEAIIEDNDLDINPEYSEECEDEPEKSSKGREQIEYQYYNDPHKKKPNNIKVSDIKNTLDSKKLTLINLTKFLKDLILQGKKKSGTRIKNTPNITVEDILSKDLDWDSKKQKALLRCLYKQNCGQGQDSDEEDNNKEDGETGDPDAGFDTTISKARHMMLLSGHYLLDSKKTNISRLDEFFESAERVQTANSKEKIKNKDNDDEPPEAPGEPGDYSRYKRAREILRALLEKNDLLSRKPPENQDLDIAMDYYFDKPKRSRERKQGDIKTPKIALILDKSNKPVKEIKENDIGASKIALILDNSNKLVKKIKQKDKTKEPKEKDIKEALRDKLHPKRKPDQYYEYLLIKELAEGIPDENIEKLYWQLEYIDKLNLRLNLDRNNSKELDAYVEVLEDMVKEDHKGLQKYDWLGTAVDLQTAIKKMMFMVEQVQNEEDIHPADLELLKYLVWLHNFAKEELSQLAIPNELRGIKIPVGKKHRGKIIKEIGLLNREWMNRIRPKPIPDEELDQFQEFVERLQNSLHDLHTALKYIGMVTKYKRQKWFENLKQIHLDNSRKRILELLIHLSSTRLIAMIEESSKNGLEDNFKKYIKTHEKEVENTKEEFVFALSLVEEFEKLNK